MKKILIASVSFIMVCGATYQKANAEWDAMDLALKNVEALAVSEAVGQTTGDRVYYTFNGDHWEGNKNGSGNWFPEYDKCRDGGANGMQVYCTKGSGNCWNGTSCLSITSN